MVRELRRQWRVDVLHTARQRHWRARFSIVLDDRQGAEKCDVLLPDRLVHLVADASFEAWLFDVCPACAGRKFELVDDGPGRRELSDRKCSACDGTGKQAPKIALASLQRFVDESVEILRRRFEQVGRRASTRLRGLQP